MAVCVLTLVAMAESRTERLHVRLALKPTCTYFSRRCYPATSQRNKCCPQIAAALKQTMKKRAATASE